MMNIIRWSNTALEPTADGTGSSASRATRLVRLWLSFFRWTARRRLSVLESMPPCGRASSNGFLAIASILS